MPESPEVETIVRQLRTKLIGQVIEKVDILRPEQWKQNNPAQVRAQLINNQITAVDRFAKFISMDFDDDCQLIIHLRMTGKLIWSDNTPPVDSYTRTIFHFKSGDALIFSDTRALGRLALFDSEAKNLWKMKIGVEPLSKEWNLKHFHELIQRSKLDAKSFLMDQKKIAGIGNIYANEILFRSHIHPMRKVNTLNPSEIKMLFNQIPSVLQLAIDKMGTSLGDGKQNFRSLYNIEGEFQNMILVYNRTGDPCPGCGAPLQKLRQKQRSSFYCKLCQK
ncbi:MAG: DNA-formamidopyrimidine glycosylase [bacterium]|nr:DNA-formamidopyrimidine glycosylase [bacterium]